MTEFSLFFRKKPKLSVIVVVYNTPRETPRTLYALSSAYQRHIGVDDYEVIVIDNGSNPPLAQAAIPPVGNNFRLIRIDKAHPSPACAINLGLSEARGSTICVVPDGARIATPGLLHCGLKGSTLYETSVVASLGWYIGGDYQCFGLEAGYDQAREDALLDSIGWPADGYRLFEIGTLDESSFDGWVQPISESDALFLHRDTWNALDGVDEQFDEPGGGYFSIDTYSRALELPDAESVILLGEGTFHQLHGGISTNSKNNEWLDNQWRWAEQYRRIRERTYAPPPLKKPRTYLGPLPAAALRRFARAALEPAIFPPPEFDHTLWSFAPTVRPKDSAIAALVELAQDEFRNRRYTATAAVARLARQHAPDEPEPQRLLSLVAGWLHFDGPPEPWRLDYHLALGDAYRMLGDKLLSQQNYRQALTLNPTAVRAHIGLALLRMPGEFYYSWLDRLYKILQPRNVIEIGVWQGASLSLVHPPTVAIGVDPAPAVTHPFRTETHLFVETSDSFFKRKAPDSLLNGIALGIGFIDGLKLYEQMLRDFIHLESYCGPQSLILLHDTVPLNELTQRRSRESEFYTGDVWKVVLCLKHYRPELEIFTIATPWTGLSLVGGFGHNNRDFVEKYDEVVAKFIDLRFSEIDGRMEEMLNIIPNDWKIVEGRLSALNLLPSGDGSPGSIKR